jgi:DNA-binding NarL/FixJ family response regulator
MMVAAAPRWRDRPRGASVTIRVFLLDDHEVVRRGVRELLEAQSDGDVVVAGEAGTAEEAYRRIPAVRPDVAILDVRLPDGDGVEVCREIRSRHPEIRCLMLTSFADDEALFDSIMAGAAGYVLKQVRGSDLVDSVRRVAVGQSLLDPSVTAKVLDRLRSRSTSRRVAWWPPHRSIPPRIGPRVATTGGDDESREEVTPADPVAGQLLGRQAAVDELEQRAATVGAQRDLDRRRPRCEEITAGGPPAEHDPMGWFDDEVLAPDRDAIDVDGQPPAGRRLQLGPLTHPADHQFGVGEIREDLGRRGVDPHRRRVGVIGRHDRWRRPCLLRSTVVRRRSREAGQSSSR